MTGTASEIGRVDDPPDAARPGDVVLLHGFLSSPWTMKLLGHRLQAAGFTPCIPWYESWSSPLDHIVGKICETLSRQTLGSARPLHFVGHSMGGLVARAVAARLQPEHMGRMVMLGTPNGGSELADYVAANRILRLILGHAEPSLVTRRGERVTATLSSPDYPVGVIAGNRPLPGPLRILPVPHDGKVTVAATHVAGEADHIVLPVTHTLMPFDRRVQGQALAFLQTGSFMH